MSYKTHRYETLRKLGIEQLPAIINEPDWNEHAHEHRQALGRGLPVRTMPVGYYGFQVLQDSAENNRFLGVVVQHAYPVVRPYG